jgi:hypothetical protein
MTCPCLRAHDLDLNRHEIIARNGKDAQDSVTRLPRPQQDQSRSTSERSDESTSRTSLKDVGVQFPEVLDREYPPQCINRVAIVTSIRRR